MNANFTIAHLSQKGLGLPDRDYYFDEDKAEIRSKYLQYIEQVFQLLGKYGLSNYQIEGQGQDSSFYQNIAERVYQLELTLARSHMSRTLQRDPVLTYNIFTTQSLDSICTPLLDWGRYLSYGLSSKPNEFTWSKYFQSCTQHDIGNINVSTVDAIKVATSTINSFSSDDIIHYLIFHATISYSPHLPHEFAFAHFEFFEKVLEGTEEMKPRWKRVLEILEVLIFFFEKYIITFYFYFSLICYHR